MSKRMDEARRKGAIDGAAAYQRHNSVSPEPPYRGRRGQAYLQAWDAGWWAAAFHDVDQITRSINQKVDILRKQYRD